MVAVSNPVLLSTVAVLAVAVMLSVVFNPTETPEATLNVTDPWLAVAAALR